MLYLIATPIGNLEDVTLRALRLLREVTLIAAEDTRHTAKLQRHYGIQTPTTSFHEHNEKKKGPQLIARLKQGDTLALVTDAGTPLLSDPGGRLVKDALSHGITVHAIPGPSAILTALVMSGFTDTSFTYAGFPPSRSSARKSWLFDLSCEPRPLVLFEAPHRIRAMLRDMLEVLGDREVALCREMTKLHEELVIGPILSVLDRLSVARGEFTVIVAPPSSPVQEPASVPPAQDLWNEFCRLTKHGGVDRRGAVKRLAVRYGLTTREAYAAVERGKSS